MRRLQLSFFKGIAKYRRAFTKYRRSNQIQVSNLASIGLDSNRTVDLHGIEAFINHLAINAMATPAPLGPPPEEAIYADAKAVQAALQSHARDNGYGISVTSSKKEKVYYGCAKGGKYRDTKDSNTHESKCRKNTSTMKTDCCFSVVAKKCPNDEPGWKVEVQNNDHNHGLMAAASALPQHRIAVLKPEERTMVRDMSALGHSPTQILNAIQKDNPKSNLILRDIYNLLAGLRVEELAGKTPIEWLRQVKPSLYIMFISLKEC